MSENVPYLHLLEDTLGMRKGEVTVLLAKSNVGKTKIEELKCPYEYKKSIEENQQVFFRGND